MTTPAKTPERKRIVITLSAREWQYAQRLFKKFAKDGYVADWPDFNRHAYLAGLDEHANIAPTWKHKAEMTRGDRRLEKLGSAVVKAIKG